MPSLDQGPQLLDHRLVSLILNRRLAARFAEQTRVAPLHRLGDAREVILPIDRLDLHPAIIRAVGTALPERYDGGDLERAADVRDVEALDALRRRGQAQRLAQFKVIHRRLRRQRQLVGNALELLRLLRRLAEIKEHVAQLRRLLEFMRQRRLLHLHVELLFQLLALAVEEFTRRLHLIDILLVGDVPDARRRTPLHVAVETVFVVRVRGRERTAAAQVELASHQMERVAQRAGVREWTEVTRAIIRAQPREGEARNGIVEVHLHQQEAFVVAEADVVARMKFLDQLAFEQQRLRLAPDRVDVEVVDGIDEGVELQVPAHAARRVEVLVHALAQIPRLAHVDDRAEAVLHQIHARLVGKLAEFVPNVIRHGHGGSMAETVALSTPAHY